MQLLREKLAATRFGLRLDTPHAFLPRFSFQCMRICRKATLFCHLDAVTLALASKKSNASIASWIVFIGHMPCFTLANYMLLNPTNITA